ncbi:hypothetical protein [Actinopolyspora mortivallis]|uniref:Uncharacterized protein n=1 Tax=Actinopolyspora mortivallis TaxID=33906 RepID=A0A2T0GXG3_ACTMO|nr:hypothetical protein [Actinopolyspora mortivallis]PRW63802.1 hypothetical protein CEP50_08440 [Actinopolyspora mortivallis]
MREHWAAAAVSLSTLVLTLLTGGVARAATSETVLRATGPMETLSPQVGIIAVVFGVLGMIVGALRRKRVPVQPENQRRS